MATIKAFTDISQSETLSKILPLESADMLFQLGEEKYADSIRVPLTKKHWEQMMPDINPCWSLSALLNIIQKTTPYKMEHFDDKKVQLTCVLGDKPWELIISDFNNEVDSCYEMILKLHEEDLL